MPARKHAMRIRERNLFSLAEFAAEFSGSKRGSLEAFQSFKNDDPENGS